MSTDPKITPRDRLEQRENDIVEAASQLFAEFGFNATSTKKIAAKAGVSEGTVFHYFNTKNDLLSAILEKMYTELARSTNEGLQKHLDTKARLFFLADNHVRLTAANNALLLRLVYVYMNLDVNIFAHLETSDLYKLNHSYTKIFDSVIKDGIHRGEIRDDINLSAIRDLFYGGLEYGIRTMMLRKRVDDIQDYVQEIITPLWESLQSNNRIQKINSQTLDERLLKACERVEAVANKMQT